MDKPKVAPQESTLNIQLEDLSEKIRQYLSGKGVREKSAKGVREKSAMEALNSMAGRMQLGPDGEMLVSDAEYDKPVKTIKAAYEEAWDQALDIKRKFPDTDFIGRLNAQPDPKNGLRYLLEWCYANRPRVAKTKIKLLDEIDQKIIKLYQETQQQAGKNKPKYPSGRRIAEALRKTGITNIALTSEAINKRIRKLRAMGLVGSAQKDKAEHCDEKRLDDYQAEDKIEHNF